MEESTVKQLMVRAAPEPAPLTRDQVALVKKTVCPSDTTDDELKLFLHVAEKSGLDPLQKQIHCTKRGGKLVIISGIDGLQARAAREPDYEGLLHGVVCAKDVVRFDAATGAVLEHTYNPFADRGAIVGAWATVKRRGRLPFTANVKFAEYADSSNVMWKTKPTAMIDKCARSSALRMAYPEQFSSVYEEAEISGLEERTVAGGPPPGLAAPPPLAEQMNPRTGEVTVQQEQPEDAEWYPEEEKPLTGVKPMSELDLVLVAISEAQNLEGLKALVKRINTLSKSEKDQVREPYNQRRAELAKGGD